MPTLFTHYLYFTGISNRVASGQSLSFFRVARKTGIPGQGVAAAQAKFVCCESAEMYALHIPLLPFGFNPGDATGTQGIGV